VIRDDDRRVARCEQIRRQGLRFEVSALERQPRYERVVVCDLGALPAQKFDDVERRTLADIADARLVGDAQQQDAAAVQRKSMPVERLRNAIHDVARHLRVHLGGEFDEAGPVLERPHLPGQVLRVDREAVAAQAGTGREAHEAVWLRRRGLDDLADVDPQTVRDDRHLVHETDVHRSEGVLQQLREFRDLGRRNAHDLVDDPFVEAGGEFAAGGGESAHDLRRVRE